MGPNVSVLLRVLVMDGLSGAITSGGRARPYYFLRKESRLTTSPGFSPAGAGLGPTGSGASPLVVSGCGVGTITGPVAGLGAPSPSARNCSPNCTPGSKKAVRALKG